MTSLQSNLAHNLPSIFNIQQNLMIMEQSEIIEYYPVNFKTDLNGKQQEWEAVVLIPFIDEVCSLCFLVDVEVFFVLLVVMVVIASFL